MAITFASKPAVRQSLGDNYLTVHTFTCDTSYPTGGYALTPQQLRFQNFLAVFPAVDSGYRAEWDSVNKKVKLFQFNYPGGAAAAATEIPNATNLSTVKVTLLAIGY